MSQVSDSTNYNRGSTRTEIIRMSQLKLSKNSTPDQPGGASAATAGASGPPPIPGAPGSEPSAETINETQMPFSIPPPGNSQLRTTQASAVSTSPPGPPPPLPPQPSNSPAAVRHAALIDEQGKGNGNGSKGIILTVVCILFLGGIGTGIFLFLRNSDFFNGRNGPPESVHWPTIELSGMAGAATTDETGSAILNGSLIAVNQRIDGATLVAIEDNGVVLEYRHEQKFIRIGERTR